MEVGVEDNDVLVAKLSLGWGTGWLLSLVSEGGFFGKCFMFVTKINNINYIMIF